MSIRLKPKRWNRVKRLYKSKVVSDDPVETIAGKLDTDARYRKAYQRVREDLGVEELEPKHIGACFKSLHEDIVTEELDWIKEQLWKAHKKRICKLTMKRFPLWFKDGGFQDVSVLKEIEE